MSTGVERLKKADDIGDIVVETLSDSHRARCASQRCPATCAGRGTAFHIYDVKLDEVCAACRDTILNWEPLREWTAEAKFEPEELEELDVEF